VSRGICAGSSVHSVRHFPTVLRTVELCMLGEVIFYGNTGCERDY